MQRRRDFLRLITFGLGGSLVTTACDVGVPWRTDTIGDILARDHRLDRIHFEGWQDHGSVFVPAGTGIHVVQPGHDQYQVVRVGGDMLDFDAFTVPPEHFDAGTTIVLSWDRYQPEANAQHSAWLDKLAEIGLPA